MRTHRLTAAVPTDAELVRQARAGRAEAFDELIERYQRRATSVAFRLLGDLHDALEVCQDAFLRAYRSLDTLQNEERFGPWLLRTVTNLALNFRRARAAGGRRVSLEEFILDDQRQRDERLAAPAYSDEQPGAGTTAAELAEVVQKALDELPAQQRAALVLFSIEQLPQREVADILECSVEAVKWHVFQARRKLKERLADYL